MSAPARQAPDAAALAPVRVLRGGPAASEAPLTATPDRLLTADQLASRWQVPKAQVYRLTREGRLPAVAIGRYYRYRLGAVEAWELNGGDRGSSE